MILRIVQLTTMLGLNAFARHHEVYFGLKYAAAMTALWCMIEIAARMNPGSYNNPMMDSGDVPNGPMMIGIPLYIMLGKLGELAKRSVRVAASGYRLGGDAKLLGRNHTSASLRHLADRLWIRRFLVRPQEGQSQAPPSLT
jgi:hypothetical protein